MVSKKPRRPVVDLEGEDESEIAAIDSLIAGHDISMVCPDAPGSVDDSGRKIVRPAIKCDNDEPGSSWLYTLLKVRGEA